MFRNVISFNSHDNPGTQAVDSISQRKKEVHRGLRNFPHFTTAVSSRAGIQTQALKPRGSTYSFIASFKIFIEHLLYSRHLDYSSDNRQISPHARHLTFLLSHAGPLQLVTQRKGRQDCRDPSRPQEAHQRQKKGSDTK